MSITADTQTWNGDRIGQGVVVTLDVSTGADSVDEDSFVTETTHSGEGALEGGGRGVTEIRLHESASLTTHTRFHLKHFAPLAVFTHVVETRGIQRLGNAFLCGAS